MKFHLRTQLNQWRRDTPIQRRVKVDTIVWIPLLRHFWRKNDVISASYLAGLFDICILLHMWQNCVFWGLFFFTNEDTLWCLPRGIWILLVFNPGHISIAQAKICLIWPCLYEKLNWKTAWQSGLGHWFWNLEVPSTLLLSGFVLGSWILNSLCYIWNIQLLIYSVPN